MIVVIASIALGAAWRRCKGATGLGLVATLTFVPLCLLVVVPLWGVLDPGKFVAAVIAFSGLSALFLLVEANNGGNGHPLRRFGPFGLGYWLALRIEVIQWTAWGEIWLGATWFGVWSAAASAAVSFWG